LQVGKLLRCSCLLGGLIDDTHSDHLSVVSLLLSGSSLDLSGILLVLELSVSDLFLLHFVNGLDQDGLVLELVTLGSKVEVMEDVLGDFLGLSVLLKQSSEHSLSAHPQDLAWHTSITSTLSLTEAGVSALSLCFVNSSASRSRVHSDSSLHDESVLEELADVLSYRDVSFSRFYLIRL